MAKKILKRSLALGALMAFVITGSAMAEDLNIENGSYTLDGTKTFDKVDINFYPADYALNGNGTLTATEYIKLGALISNLKTEGSIQGANLTISAPLIEMYYTSDSAAVYISTDKSNDFINIVDFDKLNINAINYTGNKKDLEGKGIRVLGNNNTVNVVGNEGSVVDIKASENAVYSDATTATINISASKINIFSLGIDEGQKSNRGHAVVSEGGTINIDGKESVNITAARKPNAENNYGFFEYDVYDGYAIYGTAGTININMGANGTGDVNIDGDIRTMNNAVANVNFNGGSFKGISEGKNKFTFAQGGSWTVEGASTVTEANFGAGSSLVIDGTKFTGENADYAITGKVNMDPAANLVISKATTDTNYKVVKGENNISDSNLSYDRTALVAVEKTDNVYEVEFKSIANASESELSAAQDKAVAANGGSNLVAPGIISGSISSSASSETKALGRAIMQMAGTSEQKAAIANDIAQVGEKAGNTTNAVNIVNNVTGITNQRMSFTNINTAPQGGHGKVERKYKSGAGVWAQYMHGKDKVEDLPGAGGTTSSYESQYNGAVIGYDFKEVGKTKTGIAFNYGEGDSHSKDAAVKTNNDFDFWGIGLYHSIMNEDTNLIFDINYNKTDADVTQVVPGYGKVTVSPNTTAISAGVRAEKLIQNGPVQIVPYVGARFLSIDTDEYTSSAGIKYSPDRQNIWLVPVGVSLRQENTYENGWKVTPKADLSYIWALGDTDTSMNVATDVKVDNLAYTVMDNGSFLGTLGIEAEKGDWTYGLSYSYQKGEYQRSDKWFVDVRYSF